jgi:hypothetical protein
MQQLRSLKSNRSHRLKQLQRAASLLLINQVQDLADRFAATNVMSAIRGEIAMNSLDMSSHEASAVLRDIAKVLAKAVRN